MHIIQGINISMYQHECLWNVLSPPVAAVEDPSTFLVEVNMGVWVFLPAADKYEVSWSPPSTSMDQPQGARPIGGAP